MKEKKERKERVIHTRISETLDRRLREQASGLGVSVSNLVRNVLSNTFDLVEDIVADSARVARSATTAPRHHTATADRSSAPRHAAREPRVIGWQEFILNLNAICDRCNEILPRGVRAAIAVLDAPGTKPVLCASCLKEPINDNDTTRSSLNDRPDPAGAPGGE